MKQLLLVYLLLGTTLLVAQSKVSGTVLDEFGEPVAYANVIFKDTNEGTITDENGRFYMESDDPQDGLWVSFVGYQLEVVMLEKQVTYDLQVTLKEEASALDEVVLFSGKTSKKDNPALVILRKIWEHRRENGVKKFDQYAYDKYEKLQFDLNTIDSALIKSKLFKGMEFIFDQVDTSKVTGNTYLPVFVNEAYSEVYGDNTSNDTKEILQGNKASGFENNQSLIAFVKDLYSDYDIYDNYLKFFDKAFTSPLSRTGIDVYNYVLLDSAYRDNKWCYNIVYYPRRKNELTFKGDFWVNDSTWAIKEINMQASKSANLNWVRDVYIEQEYDVLNDSVFLITRDYFMSDFSIRKKEGARGIYGKRTTLYDNYEFDREKPKSFYKKQVDPYRYEVYNRPDSYWDSRRMEPLGKDEQGVFKMLDTLKTVPRFKAMYNVGATLASGYYEFNNFDFGPIFSTFGYNEAEGLRIRAGGRTYFGQNDLWRIEGFGAYGFKDNKFKHGISGKWLVDRRTRLILFGGHRRDVEQAGASLTSSSDVLGRSLASSTLITVGANDKLTNINLSTLGMEVELAKNFITRVTGAYRTMRSATDTFSLSYLDDNGEVQNEISQPEIELSVNYTPLRRTIGYGVEQKTVNDGDYPIFFAGYSVGMKNIFGGDFDYQKLQMLYTQPWNIGGLGRSYTTVELGKIYGDVPLALLSPIPGNQTLWSIYNTFNQLDFYEFVSDTYASFHYQHDFGGRVFGRVPLLRELNLREFVGFRAVWGQLSEANVALNVDPQGNPVIYRAPEDVYWEWSLGVGNIFKVFRLDFNFRGNYLDQPDVRQFGVTGTFGFSF